MHINKLKAWIGCKEQSNNRNKEQSRFSKEKRGRNYRNGIFAIDANVEITIDNG